jgi:hypothetical protein
MDMVMWILGPERVLVITIKFIGTSFLHDHISLLFLLYFGHGLSFFLHALSMVFSFTYAFEHGSFLHSPCPFSRILLGREVTYGALFCEIDGWYNANFQCRSIARGNGVHMNLDQDESMKRILTRVTTI